MKLPLNLRRHPSTQILIGLACCACCLLTARPRTISAATNVVTVNSNGSFSPARLEIFSGDTVVWRFSSHADAIVPINASAGANFCHDYPTYNPANPNEFTGPMPRAVSGIFALSPEELPYATRDATWRDTNITGVFIRLRWAHGSRQSNGFGPALQLGNAPSEEAGQKAR